MLLFSLEWNTSTEVFDWASAVASQPQFADHTAVLLTHAYLYEGAPDPNGSDSAVRSPFAGDPAWNGLVRKHGNFEMVLNGHYLDLSDSDPHGPLTTGRQSSVGDEGNTVHEIVFNSQQQPNGGNGYLRLMEFLDNGSTVQVRTYSPTLDVWLTDDRNEFQIELTPLDSADFDFNGEVNGFDFLLWQRNPSVGSLADWEISYGMVAPLAAASAAVSEPNVMLLGLWPAWG